MSNAEMRARQILKAASMNDLVSQWELTTGLTSPAIYTVRGWLMDEIRSRNPEKFDAWVESDADDMELRTYVR